MNLIQCIQKPEAKGGIFVVVVVLLLTLSGDCLISECTFADKAKRCIFKDQCYTHFLFCPRFPLLSIRFVNIVPAEVEVSSTGDQQLAIQRLINESQKYFSTSKFS